MVRSNNNLLAILGRTKRSLLLLLTLSLLDGCRHREIRATLVIPKDKPECYDARLIEDCPYTGKKATRNCKFEIKVYCSEVKEMKDITGK
jgi:hypothetical protein